MSAHFAIPEGLFPEGPLVAWYGDDFTGSAAVLEVLAFNGIPSVLYLAPPDAAMLARFGPQRGIGIAGDARSRSPEWMCSALPPVFAALRATGARVIHYKVCSTFDSAPDVGSIGCAADIADAPFAALVVAAPRIGRWQAFGTLFARTGGGEVARLDRHPTMAQHPATPMREADVRLHLAAQTAQPIGLVDLRALGPGQGAAALAEERAKGARIVTFDVVDAATLAEVGAVLWGVAPLFVIGSQGVEDALVAHWASLGLPSYVAPAARAVDRIAVVSGSCAPETAVQIERACAAGFEAVRVNAGAACLTETWREEAARVEAAALECLSRGASPILMTASGPDDPAIGLAAGLWAAASVPASTANAALASGLGRVLARLVARGAVARVGIAGGDTSSHATAELGIVALTAEAAIAPAVPLLHGHRADAVLPPLELMLKGGQMGAPDLFIAMRDGPGALE